MSQLDLLTVRQPDIGEKRLHDMDDAGRAEAFARLGWYRYTRQWRAEQREARDAEHEGEDGGRAVARAGEPQRGGSR